MLQFCSGGIMPGVSRAESVASHDSFPKSVDTVIVGGGVIGCVTALYLAERGVSVAICEKGKIGAEASCRSAGLIEYLHAAPIKMELIARSIELWRGVGEIVEGDIGLIERGVLTLFENASDAAAISSWLGTVNGLAGVDVQILTKEAVEDLEPGVGNGWAGGCLQANALAVEPRLVSTAIASAAAMKGAMLIQNCAVRRIDVHSGRISGVTTERGEIDASNVIIAGGVWSPALLKPLGLNLPQLMVFTEGLSVGPVDGGPRIPVSSPAGLVRQEPDGGYMFGCSSGVVPVTPTVLRYLPKLISISKRLEQDIRPAFNCQTFMHELRAHRPRSPAMRSLFEENRIFQPEVSGRFSDKVYDDIRTRIPVFRDSVCRERYSGALMTSIDNLGVVSPVQGIPGLFLGTGFLYGLTVSTAVGEALADLITGEKQKVDITPYRYERFVDGSALEFYP